MSPTTPGIAPGADPETLSPRLPQSPYHSRYAESSFVRESLRERQQTYTSAMHPNVAIPDIADLSQGYKPDFEVLAAPTDPLPLQGPAAPHPFAGSVSTSAS